jgi:hypothetical protein
VRLEHGQCPGRVVLTDAQTAGVGGAAVASKARCADPTACACKRIGCVCDIVCVCVCVSLQCVLPCRASYTSDKPQPSCRLTDRTPRMPVCYVMQCAVTRSVRC